MDSGLSTTIGTVGAMIISAISLLMSLINYYKLFEPSLNIDINFKAPIANLTEVIFFNPTNNKFSDLSLKCFFYYKDILSDQNLKLDCSELFPQNIYMGPKDKLRINIDFFNELVNLKSEPESDLHDLKQRIKSFTFPEQSSVELVFKYSYTFLFINNFYYRQFKWNTLSKSWDSATVNNYSAARV